MLGIHELWLFALSGLLLNITPGPDTAYIVGRSVQLGWRGGAAAALGIGFGCLLHIVAAAVGLSALLAASAAAFTAIKLVGAGYLIYLGVQMLRSRPGGQSSAAAPTTLQNISLREVFWQGALTNALNPKVALFFLAFLPQFVDADAPHQGLAFLALGLLFDLNGTLWCLFIAAFAAKAAERLRSSGVMQRWFNRALGGLFIALGVRVALLQR
ncbi:threonine/homoserine/homoserine lactone efflux protein [Rhodopseudomonas rhenobacensis]|uniref:Threonine/homoserine/homoserine lactone efflux protein n=1 Tax=Rhodopseudomonas rhenobacensis TaxID=87461 RepID=A0A7W7Z8L5_9BRAD|nr:LysE family translocator [Rhodopseudomonas rhenobacensis]MBB5050017.1 threonine/homoserine/homoserine lactone efflux protein [Rhodopseudomonas rhenobacensis]